MRRAEVLWTGRRDARTIESVKARIDRIASVLITCFVVAASIGCGSSGSSSEPPRGDATVVEDVGTEAVLDTIEPPTSAAVGQVGSGIDPADGQVDTLFLPSASAAGRDETPLVVLVPGGGWVAADPSGLVPLAEALAANGAVVATISYRTASDEAYFPTPAHDVACGISAARVAADEAGFSPSEVVAVGHSAGAHLAAVVALRPAEFGGDCRHPGVAPDRLVGLAGPYDVTRARGPAIQLFGPDNADPAGWSEGNPVEHAANRSDMDVLLAHGAADDVVPIVFTEQFAEALIAGGHEVDVRYPSGIDHHTVYSSAHAAPLITQWLGLAEASSAED